MYRNIFSRLQARLTGMALVLTLLPLCAVAQGGVGDGPVLEGLHRVDPATLDRRADGGDTSRWDYHVSLGTSLTIAHHEAQPTMWVAPSVSYAASDRLTLRGGFVAVGSPDGAYRIGHTPSLAPRRHTTGYAAVNVEADWRVNERTTVWASLWHAGGWAQPWFDPTGEAVPLGVTALSGGVDYAVGEKGLLSFSFSMVRDREGTAPLLVDPLCYGWGGLGHAGHGGFAPWYY